MNPLATKPLTRSLFEEFRKLTYRVTGISLADGKLSLVETRIRRRLRVLKLEDPADYLRLLKGPSGKSEINHFVSAITTNVTHFWRESAHFELLDRLVKEHLASHESRLRLWSAACSTGEEPYSMAMAVLNAAGSPIDCKILATDIDAKVLATAGAGEYTARQAGSLPSKIRQIGFDVDSKNPEQLRVKRRLKQMVSFGLLNLTAPPFPMKGPFDVIFCRNVMIYFDLPTRERVVRGFQDLLRPGGYLLVGHSESLAGLQVAFRSDSPSVYRRVELDAARAAKEVA